MSIDPDSPIAGAGTVLLTHGAGSNADSRLLLAVEGALASIGFRVVRYNLPFRQKRASGPPRPGDAKEDQAGLAAELRSLRNRYPGRIVAAGHSYGGRQATLLSAEQPGLADALLLLSYPLHPPNKPSQLRTAHWPDLRIPCFFFHGGKDPFGSPAEMESALRLIPAPVASVFKDRAGHDLAGGRFDLAAMLARPFEQFLSSNVDPLHRKKTKVLENG